MLNENVKKILNINTIIILVIVFTDLDNKSNDINLFIILSISFTNISFI